MEETARIVKLHHAITETIFGIRQDTMFLGTSDGDIEQATLLLQLTHGSRRDRTWENILLQTDDEDRRKLQSLRRMNSHQRDTRGIIIPLAIQVGQEGDILQIVCQIDLICPILLLAFLHKCLHTTQELRQVLLTSEVLGILSTLEDVLADATLLDDAVTQLIDVEFVSFLYETADQQAEVVELGERSLVDGKSIVLRL